MILSTEENFLSLSFSFLLRCLLSCNNGNTSRIVITSIMADLVAKGIFEDIDLYWPGDCDLEGEILRCIFQLDDDIERDIERNLMKLEIVVKSRALSKDFLHGHPEELDHCGVRRSENISCEIDANFEEYKKLRNARQYRVIRVPANSVSTPQIQMNSIKWTQPYPGVFRSESMIETGVLKMGRCVIQPRTVKPLERTADVTTYFSVIRGDAALKSCGSVSIDQGTHQLCLQPTNLSLMSSVEIPPNSIYSIENKSDSCVLELVFQKVCSSL